MIDNSKKLGLTSICILLFGIVTFIGIDILRSDEPNADQPVDSQSSTLDGTQQKSVATPHLNGENQANLPYANLLGRWQSDCNFRHLGRPVKMSIDFRETYIRWTNRYFLDKRCKIGDEIERVEYFITYVEDVPILGDISASLFRLEPNPVGGNDDISSALTQEVFRVEDRWLYISTEDSGPDYGKPWQLDSNLGFRRN